MLLLLQGRERSECRRLALNRLREQVRPHSWGSLHTGYFRNQKSLRLGLGSLAPYSVCGVGRVTCPRPSAAPVFATTAPRPREHHVLGALQAVPSL